MLNSPPYTFTLNQTPAKTTQNTIKTHHIDHCIEDKVHHTPEQRDKRQENNLTKESITEKEMLSHQTIRDLILKSAANVVMHSINKFSPQTKLYKGGRNNENSHNSKSNYISAERIHDRNGQFLKKIYKELKDETPAWKQIQSSSQSKNKKSQLPPKPNDQQIPSHSKNISISGLTTYNFRSVKARYRLAYDSKGTQEEVSRSIASSKKRAYCSIERTEKIHLKTCPSEASAHRSLSQIITHNYVEETDTYLKAYESQKAKGELIYGEPFKDYTHASKLMEVEGINQETAAFSINQIKFACRTTNKLATSKKIVQRQRRRVNNDKQFENRRYPIKVCKVIVSNTLME